MDQPCKVANPARGQLNRKMSISLPPIAPENLISRDRFGRPVPRYPAHSLLRLILVLIDGIPPAFRGGVHLFIPPAAIGSVPILSGHLIVYRWRSLPRVRWHSASSPQASSSNECFFFRYRPGPINVRLSRMPQLKHRMLVINKHSGRPWTEVCRRYLNSNSCWCS